MLRIILLPLAFAVFSTASAQGSQVHHFHCPGILLQEKSLLSEPAGLSEKAKLSMSGDQVKLMLHTEPDPAAYSLFLTRSGLAACRSRQDVIPAGPGVTPGTEGMIGSGSDNGLRHTLIIER